jgi:hypothetical protein
MKFEYLHRLAVTQIYLGFFTDSLEYRSNQRAYNNFI